MNEIRRIIASYGRCRRYAPIWFEVHVIESVIELVSVSEHFENKLHPRDRYTWFASAKMRSGRVFCRALNVDHSQITGQWRVREWPAVGARKHVDDITIAFADWLEDVEDELRRLAIRGMFDPTFDDPTHPNYHRTPAFMPPKDDK